MANASRPSFSLHQFRNATTRAEEERDAQIEKAKASLETIEPRRNLRAQVASLEDSIIEVREWAVKAQRQTEERKCCSTICYAY